MTLQQCIEQLATAFVESIFKVLMSAHPEDFRSPVVQPKAAKKKSRKKVSKKETLIIVDVSRPAKKARIAKPKVLYLNGESDGRFSLTVNGRTWTTWRRRDLVRRARKMGFTVK